jgi:hypothetical protein
MGLSVGVRHRRGDLGPVPRKLHGPVRRVAPAALQLEQVGHRGPGRAHGCVRADLRHPLEILAGEPHPVAIHLMALQNSDELDEEEG